jgi:hypothetical protein
MKRLHKGGVIARARNEVSITVVLAELGVWVEGLPSGDSNIRVHCPFGEISHSDGGLKKELRVYADNKAYCHSCEKQYDSVSLMMEAWDLPAGVAARQLLARAGLSQSDLDLPIAQQKVNRPAMLAALAVWADSNKIDRFAESYAVCLENADKVKMPEDVASWLKEAKEYLLEETREVQDA